MRADLDVFAQVTRDLFKNATDSLFFNGQYPVVNYRSVRTNEKGQPLYKLEHPFMSELFHNGAYAIAPDTDHEAIVRKLENQLRRAIIQTEYARQKVGIFFA